LARRLRRGVCRLGWLGNDYIFFAGYVVLQYVVLGTAWNILGGYCGYVNFGSAAFFALDIRRWQFTGLLLNMNSIECPFRC
jgi:hypothetical protein